MRYQIRTFPRKQSLSRKPSRDRRGAIVLLAAIMMVFIVGMLAFTLDIGFVTMARTEVQRSADSGALAAAGELGQGLPAAQLAAQQYVQSNYVAGDPVATNDIAVEFGQWDDVSRTFIPSLVSPGAVKVVAEQKNRPMFFGRIFGHNSFNVQAEAIATYRPRDIIVVLDYSASMNDDSELKHISKLGQAAIEANLLQIYTELNSPTFGSMQWDPVYIASDNVNTVMTTLGLDTVAYPFPSGSWSDYINYVKNDSDINNAGYRKRYGYLTLTNYWLERQPEADETPGLWQTSEQPITAVKDAFSVFLAFMQQVDTNDRVGLSVYTSEDGTGKLEAGLTDNFQMIENISRQRQAGHYHSYTNISAGMEKARVELENNGREGALRMIVLMTDGKANWHNNTYNTTAAANNVRTEAQLAADNGFPIVTISLGADADAGLMQQAADITGGVHFNIPGGGSVEDYEDELKDVFRDIADDRPLRLVH